MATSPIDFSAVEDLLVHIKEQLGTRVKTVRCRSVIQLRYLAGDALASVSSGSYEDDRCVTSLSWNVDWAGKIATVRERLRKGDIPENWEVQLRAKLLS